jgi:large subunit ribosomal protein L31
VPSSLNAGTTIESPGRETGASDESEADRESGESESDENEGDTVKLDEYSAWYNSSLIRVPKESIMKEGIHPAYQEVEARCACGNTFMTRSTKSELHLEICSACHPFFTGRQKLIDTEGRVERFTKKFGVQTSEQRKVAAKVAKAAKPRLAKAPKVATTA